MTKQSHEKCTCGKPIRHGRHGISNKHYYCECGFSATNLRDFNKHLPKEASTTSNHPNPPRTPLRTAPIQRLSERHFFDKIHQKEVLQHV